jgi:hypothetical protein
MDPRAVLDAVVNRKIPSPRRESNPRTPVVQPVAQSYTDWSVLFSFTGDCSETSKDTDLYGTVDASCGTFGEL